MFRALIIATLLLSLSVIAYAEGDAQRGKQLFNDTKFANGATGKSCATCHPEGRGLINAANKKSWRMMGKNFKKLEDVVNYDIEKALHGKPIAHDSQEMKDIIAYIKSLQSLQ